MSGRPALVAAGLLAGAACSGGSPPPPPDAAPELGWTLTGEMARARIEHAAAPLPGGEVLVAGGREDVEVAAALADAERYSPQTGLWSAAAPMAAARAGHTATALADGRVLVAGGGAAAIELFDPDGGVFVPGPEGEERNFHTATLLDDGRVLLSGGTHAGGTLSTAAIFDPAAGQLVPTGPLARGRARHVATRLADGRVLVAGGEDGGGPLAEVEIYDPATGQFEPAAPLPGPTSFGHAHLLLPDGRVLSAGGRGPAPDDHRAEVWIYDPDADRWELLAEMAMARTLLAVAALPDGDVLLAGGCDPDHAFPFSERLDTSSGAIAVAGFLNRARCAFAAAPLPGGRLLVAGGIHVEGEPGATAEIHGPIE